MDSRMEGIRPFDGGGKNKSLMAALPANRKRKPVNQYVLSLGVQVIPIIRTLYNPNWLKNIT
jgi:hypothetical protein